MVISSTVIVELIDNRVECINVDISSQVVHFGDYRIEFIGHRVQLIPEGCFLKTRSGKRIYLRIN